MSKISAQEFVHVCDPSQIRIIVDRMGLSVSAWIDSLVLVYQRGSLHSIFAEENGVMQQVY